ncbi:MAG: hypothetical protein FJW20_20040 [Acidimicrobiia bacterium]|nr:hypothetical protein [Acidimicrobiia bacterium]
MVLWMAGVPSTKMMESNGTPDLTPLELHEVEHEGLRLQFNDAVRLQPRVDDVNPQFVRIEDQSLGLDAFAGTVSDLLDEVAEDLVVAWKHYAMAPDANLSPKALELKRRLLAAMEEVAAEDGGHV